MTNTTEAEATATTEEAPRHPLPASHRLSAASFFAAQDASNKARAEMGLD